MKTLDEDKSPQRGILRAGFECAASIHAITLPFASSRMFILRKVKPARLEGEHAVI